MKKRSGFTLIEAMVSLILATILMLLIGFQVSSLLNNSSNQIKYISGNEYVFFLQKKALSYSVATDAEKLKSIFFDKTNKKDLIAIEFYDDYDSKRIYPHQCKEPDIYDIKVDKDKNIDIKKIYFHLQNSTDTTDNSTVTVFLGK